MLHMLTAAYGTKLTCRHVRYLPLSGAKRTCAAATAGSRPAVLALATNGYDAVAGSLSYHGA